MAYRLVAADLDGTLRAEQQPFTPRVRAAVQRAHARGVRVVMATGRIFRTAEPFARDLGLNDPLICNQGATIRDLRTGEILFEKRIPLDLAGQVAEFAPVNVTLIACLDEEFYTARLSHDAVGFVKSYRENLHRVQSLAEFLTRGPQKLVFVNDISVTERLFVELVARFGNRLQVVRSFDRYVEITNREASKGKAVEWLAQRWGIARDEVIALGDQDNDRSMIEWAGLGVAMGNAVEGVKAMADYIAPTASDDGVAEVIEKFVLEN